MWESRTEKRTQRRGVSIYAWNGTTEKAGEMYKQCGDSTVGAASLPLGAAVLEELAAGGARVRARDHREAPVAAIDGLHRGPCASDAICRVDTRINSKGQTKHLT